MLFGHTGNVPLRRGLCWVRRELALYAYYHAVGGRASSAIVSRIRSRSMNTHLCLTRALAGAALHAPRWPGAHDATRLCSLVLDACCACSDEPRTDLHRDVAYLACYAERPPSMMENLAERLVWSISL